MVRVSGNTYPHKNAIKAVGFRWHAHSKTWQANQASDLILEQLAEMRGLIVETADGEVLGDSRTYKQRFGRCGCCGGNDY